ncbi:MAG: hypothetical protein ABJM61_05295 [Yoonia sp.]|uniref:hypothetical protein n=1 Tax=Yoonia sp. TaxID=2212373 RepID=UPI003265FBAF
MLKRSFLILGRAAITSVGLFSFASVAHSQAAQGFDFVQSWKTDGFSMPESVVSIPGHPWIYVSNVNGDDAAGFVSRVSLDGTIDTLEWVSGIQTPTGMVAYDGGLYVVDQTRVHRIEITTGKITQTYTSAEATSLNDIDVSADGEFFVSELSGGTIHRIQGDVLEPWVSSNTLFPVPNGVMVSGDSLFVGNVGDMLSRDLTPDQYGAVSRVSLEDGQMEMLEQTNRLGTWDGLAIFGDGFLASSPFNGEVWYFYGDQKSLIGKFDGGVADIGTDPEQGIVYAPLLFGNAVAAYQPDSFNWRHITSEEVFGTEVVDQFFGDEGGQSVAKSDGTIEGEFGGQVLSGTWAWEDEMFCRTSMLGDMDIGSDCLVIEVTDEQMRLTMGQGEGPSVIYDRM